MDLAPHLERYARRFAELEEIMARPDLYDNPQRAQELTREHSRLKQVIADGQTWRKLQRDLAEAEVMAKNVSDPDMAEMAEEELATLRPAYANAEKTVRFAIVPRMKTIRAIPSWKFAPGLVETRRRFLPRNWPACTRAMRSGSAGRRKRST